MDVPLSADHFGHIGLNSCIRLGKRLTEFNLAWLEDMVPWQYPELLKEISSEVDIPLCTGEDIYLPEGFEKLLQIHAVDIVHPDPGTAGGVLGTKQVGDLAKRTALATAVHFASSPVSCMATVHAIAAMDNFLAMENHSVDVEWWDSLVEGVPKPIVNNGFIAVPDKPGIGVTLNDDVVKAHLVPGTGFFSPRRSGTNFEGRQRPALVVAERDYKPIYGRGGAEAIRCCPFFACWGGNNNEMKRRDLSLLLPLLGSVSGAFAQDEKGEKKPVLSHSFGKSFDELPVHTSEGGGQSRPVVDGRLPTGEEVEIHETMLMPGQMPHPAHRHVHEEFMMIREGTVEFTGAGIPHRVGPGGVVYAASNEMHGLKNVGTTPAHYFVIAIGSK